MNGRDQTIGIASGIEFYSEEEENEYANMLIAEALRKDFEAIIPQLNINENNNGTYSRTNNDTRVQNPFNGFTHGKVYSGDRFGDTAL